MIITKKGVSRRGDKVNVFSRELCKKIRKRLKLKQSELSNNDISKVIIASNKETAKWLLENPEGFRVHRDMGYLAISKHLPNEFREDKERIIEFLKSADISEAKRKILLRRFDVEIGWRIQLVKFLREGIRVPNIDYSRFLYSYKFMWFNKRNCSMRKARVYKFEVARPLRYELLDKLDEGKEYDELNFDDFYHYKMKPIE